MGRLMWRCERHNTYIHVKQARGITTPATPKEHCQPLPFFRASMSSFMRPLWDCRYSPSIATHVAYTQSLESRAHMLEFSVRQTELFDNRASLHARPHVRRIAAHELVPFKPAGIVAVQFGRMVSNPLHYPGNA